MTYAQISPKGVFHLSCASCQALLPARLLAHAVDAFREIYSESYRRGCAFACLDRTALISPSDSHPWITLCVRHAPEASQKGAKKEAAPTSPPAPSTSTGGAAADDIDVDAEASNPAGLAGNAAGGNDQTSETMSGDECGSQVEQMSDYGSDYEMEDDSDSDGEVWDPTRGKVPFFAALAHGLVGPDDDAPGSRWDCYKGSCTAACSSKRNHLDSAHVSWRAARPW